MPRARQVKATGKGENRNITSLQGAFGKVPIRRAISDIESGRAQYSSGGSAIGVVQGQGGKFLRTAADGKSGNNLDSLPDA